MMFVSWKVIIIIKLWNIHVILQIMLMRKILKYFFALHWTIFLYLNIFFVPYVCFLKYWYL
jgi:hypothetical protein